MNLVYDVAINFMGQIWRTNRGTNLGRRRHVDGSFTSDVNKVLDSIAAKEYLQWVMNSKTSGTR